MPSVLIVSSSTFGTQLALAHFSYTNEEFLYSIRSCDVSCVSWLLSCSPSDALVLCNILGLVYSCSDFDCKSLDLFIFALLIRILLMFCIYEPTFETRFFML